MGISLSRAGPGVSSFFLTLGSFAPSGTNFLDSLFPSRSTSDRQLNIIPWKRLIKRSLEDGSNDSSQEQEQLRQQRQRETAVLRDLDEERERLNSVILGRIIDGKRIMLHVWYTQAD